MELLNMTCPSCGASVTDRINSRRVTCAYCGSRLFLDGEGADGFLEAAEAAQEDEALSGLSMPRFAQQACEEFLARTDQASFKDTPKIRAGLKIGDGDTVFLIHDDTLLKSGKNGFAISRKGIYCRGLYEEADFLDWAAFAKLDEPTEKTGGYIACGQRNVGYFTGSADIKGELLALFRKLHRHAGSI